jgi:hypothetical protein
MYWDTNDLQEHGAAEKGASTTERGREDSDLRTVVIVPARNEEIPLPGFLVEIPAGLSLPWAGWRGRTAIC